MSEPLTPLFKFGQGPLCGSGGEVAGARSVLEGPGCLQYLQHLLGVLVPVGGSMKLATTMDSSGQLCDKFRVENAPFIVALFVPGVREEEVGAGQCTIGDSQLHHFHAVMSHKSQVGQSQRFNLDQQMTDARAVDFDSQVVTVRVGLGHPGQGITVTKADLKVDRIPVAEYRWQIQRFAFKIDAVLRPDGLEGFLLAFGQATLPQYKAADRAVFFFWLKHLGLEKKTIDGR